MKKTFFILFCLVLAVLSATPQTKKVDTAFLSVYHQVLELNKDRFTDLNLIPIGATVLFPSQVDEGTEVWIANEPQNGVHDCIWILTEKYLNKEIKTVPLDNTKKTSVSPFLWLFAIIIIIAIFVIILSTIKTNRDRKNNPNNFPPVIRDLRDENSETISQEIQKKLSTEEKITNIERGYLIRESGPKKILVFMEFGDGKNREVYLKSGEKVTKTTIENSNGHTYQEFWREHCGNYFAVIKSGRVMLPQGWKFIVEEEKSFPIKEEPVKTQAPKIRLKNKQKTSILIQEEDESIKVTFLLEQIEEEE